MKVVLAALTCMWFCGITQTEPQNYIYSNYKVYSNLLPWFIYVKNVFGEKKVDD